MSYFSEASNTVSKKTKLDPFYGSGSYDPESFTGKMFTFQGAKDDWGARGKSAAAGAGTGAMYGTMILPGWGTAIGAVAGGLLGGIFGGKAKLPEITPEAKAAIEKTKTYNEERDQARRWWEPYDSGAGQSKDTFGLQTYDSNDGGLKAYSLEEIMEPFKLSSYNNTAK